MKMRCVGIGVYHAGPGGIEKPGDFGWRIELAREQVDGVWRDKAAHVQIALHCPRTGVCFQHVRQEPHGDEGGKRWWSWNGSYEAPTLMPSVGCDDLRTRCGQHMSITAGEVVGLCEWKSRSAPAGGLSKVPRG